MIKPGFILLCVATLTSIITIFAYPMVSLRKIGKLNEKKVVIVYVLKRGPIKETLIFKITPIGSDSTYVHAVLPEYFSTQEFRDTFVTPAFADTVDRVGIVVEYNGDTIRSTSRTILPIEWENKREWDSKKINTQNK